MDWLQYNFLQFNASLRLADRRGLVFEERFNGTSLGAAAFRALLLPGSAA